MAKEHPPKVGSRFKRNDTTRNIAEGRGVARSNDQMGAKQTFNAFVFAAASAIVLFGFVLGGFTPWIESVSATNFVAERPVKVTINEKETSYSYKDGKLTQIGDQSWEWDGTNVKAWVQGDARTELECVRTDDTAKIKADNLIEDIAWTEGVIDKLTVSQKLEDEKVSKAIVYLFGKECKLSSVTNDHTDQKKTLEWERNGLSGKVTVTLEGGKPQTFNVRFDRQLNLTSIKGTGIQATIEWEKAKGTDTLSCAIAQADVWEKIAEKI